MNIDARREFEAAMKRGDTVLARWTYIAPYSGRRVSRSAQGTIESLTKTLVRVRTDVGLIEVPRYGSKKWAADNCVVPVPAAE